MPRLLATMLSVLTTTAIAQPTPTFQGLAQSTLQTYATQANMEVIDAKTFYGDFSGDKKPDALAFIYYNLPGDGNSFNLDVLLLKNTKGSFRVHRKLTAYGTEPRMVKIIPGRVTFTTTMPLPTDPRCCPTGSQKWTFKTN